MKLAEAKRRVEQVNNRIKGLRLALKNLPRQAVSSTFNEVNELLMERQDLIRKISRTETSVDLGGTPIAEIEVVLNVLEMRIALLSELEQRSDLDQDQACVIYKNLDMFRQTKDNLDAQYQKCLWETDLLE